MNSNVHPEGPPEGPSPHRVSSSLYGPLLVVLLGTFACQTSTAPEQDDGIPPGPDVTEPFPIDRGDDGSQTPGTYKSLPLRLAEGGEPSVQAVDGVIGVVCIGMSNSSQECDTYITLLEGAWSDEVNPEVRVVNCARGGHAIERWIDPSFDQALWQGCLENQLPQAGVAPEQVRVLYHKAANQFTTGSDGLPLPTFPDPGSDYEAFQEHLTAFAGRVPDWFPNVVAVYTSSRSFGGFAGNPGRGEPLSYEEGHALNQWLEEHPRMGGAWYGWGPYLWAPACATGGFNGSGICYDREDYVADGVHPSTEGREKIAGLIHDRLMQHSWYAR